MVSRNMDQYDPIAENYVREAHERPERSRIFVPTARLYLGDVTGKRVLDLACGSGFFTRLIRKWGAREVIGVDISDEMLKLARLQEAKEPLGVRYERRDVAELSDLGEFDIVFAGFLLHYAPSIERLRAMCRAIVSQLKFQGRLVAFNESPFHPLCDGTQYDFVSVPHGPLEDGVKIDRRHFANGKPTYAFTFYYYKPATYLAALKDAGLSDIEWKNFLKGPDADEGFPPDHWNAFLKDFVIAVLLATKNGTA